MNVPTTVQTTTPLLAGELDLSEDGTTQKSEASKKDRHPLTPTQKIVVDSLLLVCLLAMVSVASIRAVGSMDEDLWWHLRTGNWILQHHGVPTHDSFSSYTIGKPWIAYSWFFELLVSGIYGRWGLHGILALTTFLMFACIAGTIALLSRYTSTIRAMALGTLVLITIVPLAAPRPWLFTILFFVVELYFLLQARESGRVGWMWPVVPLFALWANIHIQFIYGLGLIGLFALECPLGLLLKWDTLPAKLSTRWFWILLLISGLATLANPYGWRLYTVVLQYATETVPLHIVYEMQAMNFRSLPDWAALLLVCSAIFAQASTQRKSPLMMALLVVSCWFGFRAARDTWFLAIASALALASSMARCEQQHQSSNWKQWIIALPIGVALAFAALSSVNASETRLRQAAGKRFPEKAAEYVQNHRLRGPLYNSYGWGGYLIWRLPNMPVSIDGRANLQGDKHLTRSAESCSGKPDWAEDQELTKANTILLERDLPLASILRSDARYRVAYEDDVASVFEPVRAVSSSPEIDVAAHSIPKPQGNAQP